MQNKIQLKPYLPDNFKANKLSRNLCFTLLHTITPDYYCVLKKELDDEIENMRKKKIDKAQIELDEDEADEILALPIKDVIYFFNL